MNFSLLAHDVRRSDQHAPIGVMLDHTHEEGEVMFSVRHMSMQMRDLINDSSYKSQTNYRADNNKMMIPKSMDMKMSMLGIMYGLSKNYTLSLMTHRIGTFITVVP